MANLSWISSNPDYINQMIRNTQVALSNNYNDLDNIPIIKITSTTNNPQKIWELKEGLYMVNGVIQVDNSTSYEVSNLLISMTARLENGKYILSAFIPYLRGLFEYILKTNSTEYEQHQKIVLMIKNDTLTLDNETIYTPIENYHPATKKYVDDKANEIVAELDRMGVNKENLESLNKENRIRDIKLQALLSETSDRNITIEENVRYFDMPLSIDNGIVTINEMVGETLVNVCDQEESVAITKSYTIENENHIALQGEYDGSCRPVVYGNTLVNHNADWDGKVQTGVVTSANGTEDVQVEGIKGQEVSVVVEGNTVLNHALGKTSAVVSGVEGNLSLVNKITFTLGNRTFRISEKLKIGIPYTLIFECTDYSLNGNTGIRFGNWNIDNGNDIDLIKTTGKVQYVFTVGQHSNYQYAEIFIENVHSNNAQATIQNILLLEGDHTTNPKYVNSNDGNYVDLTVANDMSSVVEIEGRTMVNLHGITVNSYSEPSLVMYNSSEYINVSLFKPSTTYTIVTKDFTNKIVKLAICTNISDYVWLINTSYKNALTFTTPSTFENDKQLRVYYYCSSDNLFTTDDIGKISCMIFEGDLTQTPHLIPSGYFEGLSSSYESCYPGGKNLFDGAIDNSGHSSLIDISNLTNVIVSSSNYSEGMAYIRFYDKNKNKILTDINFNNAKGFSNNAHYLQVLHANYRPNLQVEEGSTATSYEPFIDKYKVDVKVTGKNLFDKNDVVVGSIDNNTGASTNSGTDRKRSSFIKVKPNTSYTINQIGHSFGNMGSDTLFIHQYDYSYNHIQASGNNTFSGMVMTSNNILTFTTENNTKFVRFRTQDGRDITSANIQLEEGTVATSYEPYFESTKTFYLNSPLLEGDKLVTKNGKLYHYHKMGVVVLDGSRTWWGSSNINGITFMATTSLFNLGTSDRKMLCDSLRVNQGINQDTFTGYNEILAHKSSAYSNACYISTQLSQSDFINWLKSNPITVVYELDTPYYELIDEYNNTILDIPKNVAHLTHTSAVPVNNTVFTNYKDELNVLEANTQYRVMFDCDKANIPFTVTLGGTSQTVTSKIGTHSLLITTPSTLVDKNLVIDGIGRCDIDNIRIFKGDVEYDYVKGLWSGYEERKLENLINDDMYTIYGGSSPSIEVNNDNEIKATSNSNCIMVFGRKLINIKPYRIYTVICDVQTTLDIAIGFGTIEKVIVSEGFIVFNDIDTNYNHIVCKLECKNDNVDKITIGEHIYVSDGEVLNIKNLLVLEGDWTDNPPTYEEVMANEGKYAVKVKLDTNATIFGKGGRL